MRNGTKGKSNSTLIGKISLPTKLRLKRGNKLEKFRLFQVSYISLALRTHTHTHSLLLLFLCARPCPLTPKLLNIVLCKSGQLIFCYLAQTQTQIHQPTPRAEHKTITHIIVYPRKMYKDEVNAISCG